MHLWRSVCVETSPKSTSPICHILLAAGSCDSESAWMTGYENFSGRTASGVDILFAASVLSNRHRFVLFDLMIRWPVALEVVEFPPQM
ncbi:unnamed protein product [Caenorhabditis brenneri]